MNRTVKIIVIIIRKDKTMRHSCCRPFISHWFDTIKNAEVRQAIAVMPQSTFHHCSSDRTNIVACLNLMTNSLKNRSAWRLSFSRHHVFRICANCRLRLTMALMREVLSINNWWDGMPITGQIPAVRLLAAHDKNGYRLTNFSLLPPSGKKRRERGREEKKQKKKKTNRHASNFGKSDEDGV